MRGMARTLGWGSPPAAKAARAAGRLRCEDAGVPDDVLRAFPIVYVSDVRRSVAFYEQFGFAVRYQHPSEGEPGYVKLARGVAEVGIVHERSPIDLIGAGKGRE